jgi:putative Ca2+/H+ antiporter (TMEM165/GDT1 family)
MSNVATLWAVLMAVVVQRLYTAQIAQWRRFMAFLLKATKCCHQASTCSNSINRTHQRQLFLTFHPEKGNKVKGWPLIT